LETWAAFCDPPRNGWAVRGQNDTASFVDPYRDSCITESRII
jgi:hypothetical protein